MMMMIVTMMMMFVDDDNDDDSDDDDDDDDYVDNDDDDDYDHLLYISLTHPPSLTPQYPLDRRGHQCQCGLVEGSRDPFALQVG